jgi:hypothetical protein
MRLFESRIDNSDFSYQQILLLLIVELVYKQLDQHSFYKPNIL